MKKIYLMIIQIILLTVLSIKPIYADTVIVLNHTNVSIGINSNITLRVTDENNQSLSDVIWKSEDPNIATVDNGIVIGKNEGKTNITAYIGSSRATCVVNVLKDYIPITEIIPGKKEEQLLINETKKIELTIKPSNASNKKLTYYSNNPDIATVDKDGNIKGISKGKTYINIVSPEYVVKYPVTVVDKIPLKGISIKSSIEIKEKSSTTLSVTFSPSNATNKKITWKSSDEKIVTVNSAGKVTAIAPGTATITAVSNDGGYVKKCEVKVIEVSKVLKGIKLNKTSLTMKIDSEETLKVTYDPTYAENKNVIWESTNESVATVKDGKIKAIGPGTTTIKVTSVEGNYQAMCKINVSSKKIESISFEQKEQTVEIGNKIILKTIPKPSNSAIIDPIWTSSNEQIATVEDGVLVAKMPGEATITVSSKDGKIKATTKVIVIKPIEPVDIKIEGYDLNFDPEIKSYTIKIEKEKKLNITTNQDEVTINGNDNLKNGSIITVNIDGENKSTYIINIKKDKNAQIYFIVIIAVLLLINLIRILSKLKNK